MIRRYKWDGNFTAQDINSQLPVGVTGTVSQIGPLVFVDIELLPDPVSAEAQEDLDDYLKTLGWSFIGADLTTPVNSVGCVVSVYDAAGGQAFTGTVPVIFDTVSKNMSTGLYTFDPIAGTIEVLEAGTYEAQFDVTLTTNGNSRITSCSYLTNNGILVPGTNAYAYHRSSVNGEDTASMSLTLDLAQNDVIGVDAQRLGTSGTALTVASGSRFTLRRVA
jgi:hypothetical protein